MKKILNTAGDQLPALALNTFPGPVWQTTKEMEITGFIWEYGIRTTLPSNNLRSISFIQNEIPALEAKPFQVNSDNHKHFLKNNVGRVFMM